MVKSLLDSLLGGVKDLTAGQNMGQMANQLSAKARTTWAGQSTLTKGAVAGGLLAMLLSGNARKLVGTGAKIGGAALIGGLAFKAYEDWKSGKSTAEANPDTPLALPQPSDAFLPSDQTDADALSQCLLQAMIAAAKADGQITPAERARITDTLPQLGLGPEAQDLITAELDTPLDISAIAALAQSEEQATEIYAASLLAIDPDGAAEQGYLALLAARLQLDPGLVDHLHARARTLR
jgi:uncharacterized membrane protein YebE (DUF533 family)